MELQLVSSAGKSFEVNIKFQVMDQFVLEMRICPNVIAFLLGYGDK